MTDFELTIRAFLAPIVEDILKSTLSAYPTKDDLDTAIADGLPASIDSNVRDLVDSVLNARDLITKDDLETKLHDLLDDDDLEEKIRSVARDVVDGSSISCEISS